MFALIPIIAQIVVGAVVSSVAGALLQKFTSKSAAPTEPKTDRQRAPTDAQRATDPLDVAADPGGPCIGLFGRRRVGGRVIFSALDKNDKRYLVIVLANAQITSIDGMYIDNLPVAMDSLGRVTTAPWTFAITAKFYTGNQVTKDAALNAAFPGWSNQHIGRETAYVRLILDTTRTPDPFANGVPDFTFLVRGHKCYDPRLPSHNVNNPATWAYSDNPAIISANYLLSPLGKGKDTSPDDIDWQSVRTAARICDEQVALRGGDADEDRYTCAVRWLTDEPHESVLERIGQAMGGGTYPSGGLWRVTAAAYVAPTVTLTPDSYVNAGLSWSEFVPIQRRVNGVRGTFSSPAHGYEPRDFPAYQDGVALILDGGRESWLDLDLTTVTSPSQAQRLARIAYRTARDGFPASLESKFENLDVVANDTIAITDALAGFVATPFKVLEDEIDGFDLRFSLRRESADFYAWNAATDEKVFIAEPPIDGGAGSGSGSGWTATYEANPLLEGGAVLYGTVVSASRSQFYISFFESVGTGYRHEWQFDVGDHIRFPEESFPSAIGTAAKGSAARLIHTQDGMNDFSRLPEFGAFRYRSVSIATGVASPWRPLITTTFTPISGSSSLHKHGVYMETVDNFTVSNSLYYSMPAAKFPLPSDGTAGGVRLTVPQVVCDRATHIELLVSATNDVTTATIHATVANGGAGAIFNYPRVANQTRYFWARASAGAKKGPASNVVAVTFA